MAEVCAECPSRSFLSDEALGLHIEAVHGVDAAREFKASERKTAAKSGKALKDGSFPIKTKADLRNAISAYGRAKDKAKAKAHIISRAKALGATDMLPDDWKQDNAMATPTPPPPAPIRPFPTTTAGSRVADGNPGGGVQFRRIVEHDWVNGEYVTRVIQDYTPETYLGGGDKASLSSESSYHRCLPCNRSFQDLSLLGSHFESLHPMDKAEAVLTFDVIRDVVREALRTKHTNQWGERVWVYVADMAADWVVYEVGSVYWKSSYTIDETSSKVTFGDPVQVVPRMTYLEVTQDS